MVRESNIILPFVQRPFVRLSVRHAIIYQLGGI